MYYICTMKKKKEIEVKVEPHSSSLNYYCIYYRKKRKINIFNFWNRMVEVYDGASLSYRQPVMFQNFYFAVEYAKKLKENPHLIEEHYKKEDEKYEKCLKEREYRYNKRNKSIIL